MSILPNISKAKFDNQSTIDYYMDKHKPLNASIWFNLKVWLENFSYKWSIEGESPLPEHTGVTFGKVIDLMPITIPDFHVSSYTTKSISGKYHDHRSPSESHDAGRAIDISTGDFKALYLFFRYLHNLQKKGSPIRIHISLINHHIHIDNRPDTIGKCYIEYGTRDNIQIRKYDELNDNDVRKHYNMPELSDDEKSGIVDKITNILVLLLIIFGLFIMKGGR